MAKVEGLGVGVGSTHYCPGRRPAFRPDADSLLAVPTRAAPAGWPRVAHRDWFALRQGSHRIGHDPWRSPTIASSGRLRRKRCCASSGSRSGRRLARNLRIMASESVVLPIAVIPFAVGVNIDDGVHHVGAGCCRGFTASSNFRLPRTVEAQVPSGSR